MLFILFLFFSSTSKAITFNVMINAEGGISAVDTLVEQGHQNPRPSNYLMATLTEYPPDSITYLIIDRPIGNLLELVNENPNWVQAQLYRYVIVRYPFGVDATPILQSLQNDPLVEYVYTNSLVLNPIVFEPEPLISDTNTFVNIALNPACEDYGYPGTNIQGLTHNINHIYQTIELEVIMMGAPPSTTFCQYQTAYLTLFDLGILDSGHYTLKLYKHYGNSSFPIETDQREYIGERDFYVNSSRGLIKSIPIMNYIGILTYILLILILANIVPFKPQKK